MRAALRRYIAGRSTALPFAAQVQLVAARYGQAPADVRAWPADDFMLALAMLPATAPPDPRSSE